MGLGHTIRFNLMPSSFVARPPDVRRLPYRPKTRGVAPLVDVYRPVGDVPDAGAPSVLLIHGGGFVGGSRRQRSIRFIATRLAEAGVAVAAADHRLLFRGGPLEAQRDDIAALRNFWHARGPQWGLDPHRVSAVGLSAGGALVLFDAAESDARYHRVVSIYGVYDFIGLSGPGSRAWRTALLGSPKPEVWAKTSPMSIAPHVGAPVLLLHGTEDGLVPYEQAQRLVDARGARPTTLRTFDGHPHGWLQDPSDPASELAAREITDFVLG